MLWVRNFESNCKPLAQAVGNQLASARFSGLASCFLGDIFSSMSVRISTVQGQQDAAVQELADIMQEMAKRLEEQDARQKNHQRDYTMEVGAMKRRMEDMLQSSLRDCRTIREEYDTAVDSLGNLMEDVARRVTKAVQHYEERFSCDLDKLREHVDKSLSTHGAVLSQKIDAAMAAMETRTVQEMDREDSEDGATGSASTKLAPNNPEVMRRVESIGHMLRAEALAQSQAFEAKLASVEASHSAESKRLQGMLSSSFSQLQGLQRSISQLECGLASASSPPPHLENMLASFSTGQLGASPTMSKSPSSLGEKPDKTPEKETEGALRQELASKLRGIASSVQSVLCALDETTKSSRGQSPVASKRGNKSPVHLPLNPAGTLEKQMRQKDTEAPRPNVLASTLKQEETRPGGMQPQHARVHGKLARRRESNPGSGQTARMAGGIDARVQQQQQQMNQYAAAKARVTQPGMQMQMPPHMVGRMNGVFPVARSGAVSPQQAMPINFRR
ncbi:unnamed protein product [Effrenium voratum]|nr:unnamed protein product [Effrenium voratum]